MDVRINYLSIKIIFFKHLFPANITKIIRRRVEEPNKISREAKEAVQEACKIKFFNKLLFTILTQNYEWCSKIIQVPNLYNSSRRRPPSAATQKNARR